MAVICIALAGWYMSWLLQGQRVGTTVLFGLLIAAEGFNVAQALGFWWTCAHQRVREHLPRRHGRVPVDVMIPVYDEPVDVVEPTVAAAARIRGHDVRVWLLDDGRRAEMAEIADRHRVGYIVRLEPGGAKAGNLNHALDITDAPIVAVLDCDHVPRPDFLERTVGHLEEYLVAYVQTPQYYANAGSSPIAAAAAAQQGLFFGPICRGKDGVGAAFCCGTNVVFRRRALEHVGGFAEDSLTEDFELSVRLHERGWRSAYVPEVLASGLGPEDMASYVSQQQRWARGCLEGIPAVLRSKLPWRLRIQYLLSATYFLSGFTLLVYMSLPVIRILFGAQPLAASTADQFLLHFAPYYCAALATVALAGSGTYTFNAFALAAGSFWIHIQAFFNALLRRPARFVVTPKHGAEARQPRAIAPILVTLAVLLGACAYGLARSQNAATLNNVAFASLHAAVLLTAALPALRVRSSQPLLPEAPEQRVRRYRRWPRPVAATALAAALLAAVAVGAVGSKNLDTSASTLPEKAHASAESFMGRYVDADGRVVRHDQGGDTVSEGQAYAMLLAVALDDRARFNSVWGWARKHLQTQDGLLATQWSAGKIVNPQPATDADLDASRALVLAGKRFGSGGYTDAGTRLGEAVLDHETASVGGHSVLVAGPWGVEPPIVNPSYFSPRAYADLNAAHPDPRWDELAATSRSILSGLTAGGTKPPPDWAAIETGRSAAEIGALAHPIDAPSDPSSGTGSFGLDAARVPMREGESCVAADRRIVAGLAPLLNGDGHPTFAVSAGAAEQAAGEKAKSEAMLDRAAAADSATPTYYGAAWVALGRVMLDSSALGNCPGT
jgi:cellulose synthase (UDP-forming)